VLLGFQVGPVGDENPATGLPPQRLHTFLPSAIRR
jgi:hypothetical protein